MVNNIKAFLNSLNEFPDGKYPPQYYTPLWRRSIVLGYYCYLTALLAHALFIILFLYIEVYFLALFNILSVTIWATSFYLHRRGAILFGFNLGSVEIIIHAILCIVMIGWGAGFQYYLIYPAIVLFFTPWSSSVKATWTVIYSCTYVGMFIYSLGSEPYATVNPNLLLLFYQCNIIILWIFGTLVAHVYFNTLIEIEENLENAHQRTNNVLTQLNGELTEAADYVRKILPQPVREGSIRTNWHFVPSTSLGGDAFGYHRIDDENLAAYLIDVSGHGVGAALLSISVINVLRSQSLRKTDFKDPGQVLGSLNKAFPSESNKDMFFTMWYGVYNENSRELTYASGGHPPAILFKANPESDDGIQLLRTPNYVIGGMPEATYTTEKCFVGEGNTLYIYSDGVYEIEKTDGSMWRFQEFTDYMQKVRSETHSVLDLLYSHVKSLGNTETLEDDFTILEVVFG
jgi:sigma-B regulation protein RsbU (phosphoserine phosphatase)